MEFHNNGSTLLVTTNDSRLRLYRLHANCSFSLVAKFKGLKCKLMQIQASWSPHGDYIISGSEDNRVCVWQRDNFPPISPHFHKCPTTDAHESFVASNVPVTCARFGPTRLLPDPRGDMTGVLTPPSPTATDHESLFGQLFFTADTNGTIRLFFNNGLPRSCK